MPMQTCYLILNKGSLRLTVSACVYRSAAHFHRFKMQRNAISAIRNIPIENVPHCVKSQRNWLSEPCNSTIKYFDKCYFTYISDGLFDLVQKKYL